MPPRLFRPLVAVLMLCLTGVALAQDAGDGGGGGSNTQTTNVFQMFFWSSDIFGLLIIWLLILMSLVSIALSIMFAIQTRRSVLLPDEVRDELEELISTKKYRDAIEVAENDPSYLAKLTHGAMAEAGNGFSAMERAIEESGDAETSRLLRPIEYLNVLGNISPMLGLFGTVYGMIRAFEMLRTSAGQADPNELAGGISTALVTTLWGLIVAIPALTAYALIRNKVDAMTSEGMVVVEELIAPFKPSGKRDGGSKSRPRATPKPETDSSGKDKAGKSSSEKGASEDKDASDKG